MLQQTLLYSLTFISGLFFGSFLNLVSDRVVKNEKILFGRSKCDYCKKTLKAKNLIPLLSFILQKGKCSMCGKKLEWYYPFSEILTGLMFVGTAFYSALFFKPQTVNYLFFAYLTIVGSFYIILLLTDLKYRLIPNKIVYLAIAVVIAYILVSTAIYFFSTYKNLKSNAFGVYLLEAGYLRLQIQQAFMGIGRLFLSAFGIGLFFWFLVFITKGRGMGGGDITLAFLIGLFNGFPYNIVAIFLGFLSGALLSIILVILKLRTIKDTVPFGPFLIFGSVLTLVWGQQFLDFYLGFMR